jgi:transposase
VLFWGAPDRASPVDRARIGSKHHLLTDANGVPLAIALTGGNRNDVTELLRWVVERTFAWLHNFRGFRIRYEREPANHQAFLHLGCAVICRRMLGWA